MGTTKEYVLQWAQEQGYTTAPQVYFGWHDTYDAIPPPPADLLVMSLDDIAEWIAANYTGANPEA